MIYAIVREPFRPRSYERVSEKMDLRYCKA